MTAGLAGAPLRKWVAGARPRTLPASVSPVLVGTALAAADQPVLWWRAGAALVVSLALQIGVNFANDYSDGRRGTDAARRGPVRLTASGAVAPSAVRTAAICAFGVAAVSGAALAVAVDLRLALVGAVCIAAAGCYTGGPRPYGYHGLGEVAVLVFFGLVATAGSAYVQLERVPGEAVVAGLVVGLLACAILVANNLRDIDTDGPAGKRTLAVVLGAARTRVLFRACVLGAFATLVLLGLSRPTALIGLVALPLAVAPLRTVSAAGDAPSLIGALVATARLQLATSVALSAGLWWS